MIHAQFLKGKKRLGKTVCGIEKEWSWAHGKSVFTVKLSRKLDQVTCPDCLKHQPGKKNPSRHRSEMGLSTLPQ